MDPRRSVSTERRWTDGFGLLGQAEGCVLGATWLFIVSVQYSVSRVLKSKLSFEISAKGACLTEVKIWWNHYPRRLWLYLDE
jgi:hypothetical protein